MVKSVLQVASFIAATGLLVPALAQAQAIPRTTSGTTSSGSGGGSSSGGGGGGGTVSSGGGGGSTGGGVTAPPSAPSSGSSGSGGSSGSEGSLFGGRSRTSTTTAKGKDSGASRTAPGGVATGTAVGAGSSSAGSSSSRTAPGSLVLPAGVGATGGRPRGSRPITGEATARPETALSGDLVAFPFFGPWGRWYPWYTGGFGWNAGFMGYSPWNYGGTCWQWGRYGAWYDPYSYCWDPFWYDAPYASGGGSRSASASKPRETMGSLRLKASPSNAKVYIDGALVGTVDEFDGLSDRLEIEGGSRVLELKADGFQDYKEEIVVAVGKTKTVRISMKKK